MMANDLYKCPIPRLDNIRWVPRRYHHALPLELMKRYQCTVIGAAGDRLTVAITDQQPRQVIEFLEKVTGYSIFAVLVDPVRMRLLISSIERCERRNTMKLLGRPCYIHSLQLYSILQFLRKQQEPWPYH